MALTEKQTQTRLKYAREKLKRIPLDVQKDKYEEIKAAADKSGEKVNAYIKKAIDDIIYRYSFPLGQSINFDPDIEKKLSQILMDNSDLMYKFSRESSSTGESNLFLYFKANTSENLDVVEKVKDMLSEMGIEILSEKGLLFPDNQ